MYSRLGTPALHSCAKLLGDLAVMTLRGASHSFNPALAGTHRW